MQFKVDHISQMYLAYLRKKLASQLLYLMSIAYYKA